MTANKKLGVVALLLVLAVGMNFAFAIPLERANGQHNNLDRVAMRLEKHEMMNEFHSLMQEARENGDWEMMQEIKLEFGKNAQMINQKQYNSADCENYESRAPRFANRKVRNHMRTK